MKAKIIWIEGKKIGSPTLLSALGKKGHLVEVAANAKSAQEIGHQFEADLIIVNAPSMRSSGRKVCHALSESFNGQPILMISDQEENHLEEDGIQDVLLTPVTSRKLLNAVRRILPGMLKTGPLTLNLEDNTITCNEHQQRLTPRLAKLLQKLMQHPGEVIERKKLFGSVWNTDYTDDTRTLDVHISWLRRVIETDPKDPKYIITIRGVGYRLDV